MSPEQVEGQVVDARSDVFSFGAVLYEMLTGHRAFQGQSTMSIMSAILRDSPTPIRNVRVDVPADVERALRRCLEKNRESRYTSGVELHQDLRACQTRLTERQIGVQSLLRRPRVVVPAVVALVAILAALACTGDKARA
jgi:serine/threonine protein kinase